MEKQTPVFVSGLFWRKPHEKAPEFIRGKLNIRAEMFIKFLRDNDKYIDEKGWINLNLLRSKDGGSYYFTVDTWKPPVKNEFQALRDSHNKVDKEPTLPDEEVDKIPF